MVFGSCNLPEIPALRGSSHTEPGQQRVLTWAQHGFSGWADIHVSSKDAHYCIGKHIYIYVLSHIDAFNLNVYATGT